MDFIHISIGVCRNYIKINLDLRFQRKRYSIWYYGYNRFLIIVVGDCKPFVVDLVFFDIESCNLLQILRFLFFAIVLGLP